MARRIKLKPTNKQQQLSYSLKQPYGVKRSHAVKQSLDSIRVLIGASTALNLSAIQLEKSDREALGVYIVELEALVASPDPAADVATQVMSLERQVAAKIDAILAAQPAALTVSALHNFQQAYQAVSAKVLAPRAEIDTLPQAASYFDHQRLQTHQEKTAELSQGVSQAVTAAKTAVNKLGQGYRPVVWKAGFRKSATPEMWEDSLDAVCTQAKALDSALRKASEEFDYTQFVLCWRHVPVFDDARFQIMTGLVDTWANTQQQIIPAGADRAAEERRIAQAVAERKTIIDREKVSVQKLMTEWSAYRGLDAAKMQQYATDTALPVLPAGQAFTTPVDFQVVAEELVKLKADVLAEHTKQAEHIRAAVEAVERTREELTAAQQAQAGAAADAQAACDTAKKKLAEVTAETELAMARIVCDAVSAEKSHIQQLLSATDLAEGSPEATYAAAVRDYCKPFVSPIRLLHRCAEDQAQFQKDYEAIAKDLAGNRLHSDASYKAAMNQRLRDYKARIAANKTLLHNLAAETLSEEQEALKAQVKTAQAALEAEAKKCQELFDKQMKATDVAHDKSELQTFIWAAQDVERLARHFEAQFKAQHPQAAEADCTAAVVDYTAKQKTLRSNFLNGQGIPPAALEEVEKINIAAELDAMHTFDFGGISVEMKVIRKGQLTAQGEKAKADTPQPGTYEISIRETKPTAETEQALARFLKLLAERGKNPPSKPVGKVQLSYIAVPFGKWTKASKEAYMLERALFYGKIALKNGVKFEVTDPAFTPELHEQYAAAMAGYQTRQEAEQEVENYCQQLSLAAAGNEHGVDADGTIDAAHGVTYPRPQVLQALQMRDAEGIVSAVDFKTVAVLVERLPRADREGDVLATALSDALRALAGAAVLDPADPNDGGNPAQKLKNQIATFSATLVQATQAMHAVEEQYLDIDLTAMLVVARKQWARMMVANALLAPTDCAANSAQLKTAEGQLFQGAEAEVDKQSLLEQAYLTLHSPRWNKDLEMFEPADDDDDDNVDHADERIARLTAQLAEYAKRGTPTGLAHAEGGQLRQYSLLLAENARGGFAPLNKVQLLERMVQLTGPLVHAKELTELTQQLEVARTRLSAAQAAVTDVAPLDPALQETVARLEREQAAKKQALTQAATQPVVLLSAHQLEIAQQLKTKDFAPFEALCHYATQTLDQVAGLVAEAAFTNPIIDAIKGADATRHANNLEQALRDLAQTPPKVPQTLHDTCVTRTGYEPTAQMLTPIQVKLMEAYCQAVLANAQFNLGNATPPSSFFRRDARNIGSKQLSIIEFTLAANQYLAGLTQSYDKAKSLAAENPQAVAAVEQAFVTQLRAQVGALDDQAVHQEQEVRHDAGADAVPLLYRDGPSPTVDALKQSVNGDAPFMNQLQAIQGILNMAAADARREQAAVRDTHRRER